MSVNSSVSFFYHCADSKVGLIISSAFIVTKTVLFIPLSILVLYLGHQRCRQQRSFATTSHSDIFTCHNAVMELISTVGSSVYLCSSHIGPIWVVKVGIYAASIVLPGQMFFHILTCVERYLAVVHPVTYLGLGLRQSGGVKIRNISIGCVWLLCFGWLGLTSQHMPKLPVVHFLYLLVFSLIVVSFCSLSVLCVLIRPGPGEVGRDRERVHQSKQRALHTVMAIMGVLWLWFAGLLVCLALEDSELLSHHDGCILLTSANWLILPSSLVLPLLFLHRAGKLPCCH